MFNNLKKKMVERTNKKVLEYVINTPDVWLKVLKVINNRYENKIFGNLKIENNRFNNLTLDSFTILGGISINNNVYIPEDENLKDKKPFIELSNSEFHKDFESIEKYRRDKNV